MEEKISAITTNSTSLLKGFLSSSLTSGRTTKLDTIVNRTPISLIKLKSILKSVPLTIMKAVIIALKKLIKTE